MTVGEIILFVLLYFACIAGVILFFIFKNRNKIRAIILKPSMLYKIRKVKTKTNKLLMSKKGKIRGRKKADYSPDFSPSTIFHEEKSWWKFWRLPHRIVLLPEKASHTVGWKQVEGTEEKSFSELAWLWSLDEIVRFIKKEVLKARMETKPMSMGMFYLLMMLVAFNLMLTFLIFNRIGF